MAIRQSVNENRWSVKGLEERGSVSGKNLSHGIDPERRGESGSFGVGR